MVATTGIVFFDIAMVTCLLVMAYLSKRLGDALKVKPYYLALYGTAILVGSATLIDIFAQAFAIGIAPVITHCLRMIAGVAAVLVCWRYWNWLFGEFFGS